MKLWLILDPDNGSCAMESIKPDFLNKLHIEGHFWHRKLLTSISETGRLRGAIFPSTTRYYVSLYRLMHYHRKDVLKGIDVKNIDALVDAVTAGALLPHVDSITIIRQQEDFDWSYGRFTFPSDFELFSLSEFFPHQGVHIRFERWVKKST